MVKRSLDVEHPEYSRDFTEMGIQLNHIRVLPVAMHFYRNGIKRSHFIAERFNFIRGKKQVGKLNYTMTYHSWITLFLIHMGGSVTVHAWIFLIQVFFIIPLQKILRNKLQIELCYLVLSKQFFPTISSDQKHGVNFSFQHRKNWNIVCVWSI